ncbi:hypothetical protein C8R44DRAFT_751991 [Mycena epipterygia]|nr:hypothetical protein C8R44DRAFT_751991 [Mycena epipterygia]
MNIENSPDIRVCVCMDDFVPTSQPLQDDDEEIVQAISLSIPCSYCSNGTSSVISSLAVASPLAKPKALRLYAPVDRMARFQLIRRVISLNSIQQRQIEGKMRKARLAARLLKEIHVLEAALVRRQKQHAKLCNLRLLD